MNESKTPDAELLRRLAAGEKRAFEDLVKTYHHQMKSVATAIVGESLAEEVVQESWLSVIKNIDKFEQRSSLKTWLISITMNEARSRLRKTKREVLMEDPVETTGLFDEQRFVGNGHWARKPTQWHDSSPEALLSVEDFRRCLEKTLSAMPDLQRDVLTLRELQGLALDEICNILDITSSNIRVTIHRARAKVYAMVEHFEETGEC